MEQRSEVVENRIFRALADPTRRALLTSLQRKAQSVGELTAQFDMTQSAVSQHLKVLREAAIVEERKAGRLRVYRFRPEALLVAREWLDQHVEFWASRLENLGDHLRKKHGSED